MSSAQNHRVRSRSGYKMKAAAFNNLQRSNYIRQEKQTADKRQSFLLRYLVEHFCRQTEEAEQG